MLNATILKLFAFRDAELDISQIDRFEDGELRSIPCYCGGWATCLGDSRRHNHEAAPRRRPVGGPGHVVSSLCRAPDDRRIHRCFRGRRNAGQRPASLEPGRLRRQLCRHRQSVRDSRLQPGSPNLSDRAFFGRHQLCRHSVPAARRADGKFRDRRSVDRQ